MSIADACETHLIRERAHSIKPFAHLSIRLCYVAKLKTKSVTLISLVSADKIVRNLAAFNPEF